MSVRKATPWILAAIGVLAGGLALGEITASPVGSQGARPAEGSHGLDLPRLARAAALPALNQEPTLLAAEAESPIEATEATSEAGESSEAYVPVKPAAPSSESTPSAGGGSTGGNNGDGSGGGGIIESP